MFDLKYYVLIAKQRKEGSFRERKVFSTKGRYQWGPGRYFMYLVILLRQFSEYEVLFQKGRYTGIKGSVSFKEQTVTERSGIKVKSDPIRRSFFCRS